MRKISFYGSDYDLCLNLKQVEASHRNSHPCINDDTLVQHPVKDVYKAGFGRHWFHSHARHRESRGSRCAGTDGMRRRRPSFHPPNMLLVDL